MTGPTREFPEGKFNEEDEGELAIAIFEQDGRVVIDFGAKISWIAMSPDHAHNLAAAIEAYAKRVEDGVTDGVQTV